MLGLKSKASQRLHLDTNSPCFGKYRASHIPHGRYSVPSSGARPDLMQSEMVSKIHESSQLACFDFCEMNMISVDRDHLGLAHTGALGL